MLEQVANAITFFAFFAATGVGKTGITVTVDVYRGSTGASLVSGSSATEVGGGIYKYTLASGSTAIESEYVAIFKTSDVTVDSKHLPSLWAVGRAGIEKLDLIGPYSVTVVAPVASNGTLTLVQGDDYLAADGRALDFTFAAAPVLTGSSPVKLTFQRAGVVDLAVTGVVQSATALRFELTAAQTELLVARTNYAYDVEATLSNGHKVTLQLGRATIQEDYS